MTSVITADQRELDARLAGTVFTPADTGWDAARTAWNVAVDQRPAAVVYPVDEDDVAAAVAYARETGLRIAPQGTGQNAAPLGSLDGTILVRTSALRGVEIDTDRCIARVRAGDLWQDVMGPASGHGLTALAGSSPDVGVVGYSLGGGIGWLARKYGMQTNSVTAVELVTPGGDRVRADRDHEPDLFWALRGGGGNFGVVTAIEFALYPITAVYAGALVWDWHESERVLTRWTEWAATAPDEISTSARIMQLPPLPEIPEPIRGRQIVMIDGAYTGDVADAEAALAPLRELGPEIDMFAPMPTPALVRLHGDPEQPVPVASGHTMVGELGADGTAAFVAAAGPDSGSALLFAELRQLGGALGRVPEEHGALARLDGQFAVFGVGIAATPEVGAAVEDSARALTEALRPWSTGSRYLNFSETPTDTRTAYEAETFARLQAVRAQVDPQRLLHANHELA
jgi:hypothetical protein